MAEKTGREVVAQAKNNSWWNREPAAVRGAVVGTAGAVATVAVIAGWIPPEQKQIIEDNAGTIVVAAFALVPVAQGIWTRFAVWSGRSAARAAVASAEARTPILDPPP